MKSGSHLCLDLSLLLGNDRNNNSGRLGLGDGIAVVAVVAVVTVVVLFLVGRVRGIRGVRVGDLSLGLAVHSGRLSSRLGSTVDLGRSLLGLLIGLRLRRVRVRVGVARLLLLRVGLGIVGGIRVAVGFRLRLGLGLALDLLGLLRLLVGLLLAVGGGLDSDVLGKLLRLGLRGVVGLGDTGVLGRERLASLCGLAVGFLDLAHCDWSVVVNT